MPSITKRLVDSLRPSPRGDDVVVWDERLPGFGARVKPSGVVSYLVQYRNRHGLSRRYTLGRHGVLTAEEARDMAKDHLADVRRGADPAEVKLAARRDLNVRELCDLYLAEGPAEKPGKKASSWEIDKSNIRRHIVPLLGRRKLHSLTRNDVMRFQRDVTEGETATDEKTGPRGRAIVEGGAGIAARATAVLGAILGFAMRRGLRADNPARGVELNKLAKRERFLTAEEFASLGDALTKAEAEGTNRNAVAALRLLMLTGARRNEICGLRWEWVDFERAMLRLPDSKTGAKAIPLGAPALKILSALPRSDDQPWVFPAARGDGHFAGLPRVWRKIAKAAGLKNVRIHDLRHSFASVSVADGASLFILGKVLGHSQSRTTEKYSHLGNDPVRAVADSTAKKIAAAMKGGGGNVVEIQKSKRRVTI
jgi:integrase